MTEEDKTKTSGANSGEDGDGKTTEPKDPSAGTKNTESGDSSPGPIPYDRFKEVNDRAKVYETRLAELEKLNTDREAAEETKRTERLKEQEKFQELANEWEGKFVELQPQYDAAQKELNTVRAILERYAESQLEQVPELFRDVVSKLPLTNRLEWLTENSDKLGKTSPTGIPSTPVGSKPPGELSDDERRKRSARTF